MDVKPIKTEADYEAALEEIDRLMNAEPGTPEGDRLDVLTTLVEAWEEKHHQIEDPDPIEAILRGSRKALAYARGVRQGFLAHVPVRKALFVEELTDAELEAISKAEVPTEHDHLDIEDKG